MGGKHRRRAGMGSYRYKGFVHDPKCQQGKRGYLTKKDAKQAVNSNTGAYKSATAHIYRCESCDLWHTTRMPYTTYERLKNDGEIA